MTSKLCLKCKNLKLTYEFSKDSYRKDGLQAWCKKCQASHTKQRYHSNLEVRKQAKKAQDKYRLENKDKVLALNKEWYEKNPRKRKEYFIRFKFNLSLEEYDAILLSQNGLCAICRETEKTANRSLAIDHCHKTGTIRGLLCGNCNQGIGKFKDDTSLLENAILYLQKVNKKCAV